MWHEAIKLGREKMKKGQYWRISNVRMKLSPEGMMEGSFREAMKAKLLDETDVAEYPELKALLKYVHLWFSLIDSENSHLSVDGRRNGRRRTQVQIRSNISFFRMSSPRSSSTRLSR